MRTGRCRREGVHHSTAGIPGAPERLDRFGGEARPLNDGADSRAGLIASAPGENTDDGYSWVFAGTSGGLRTRGVRTLDGAALGAPRVNARFGSVLAE
ncbi:hypothetical protein [Streptomyces sp. 184]|uniref:hypothetical protein n=1 Tax=Streptomyces sp. 184 TaxID=1827526 RepID=UPI0038927AA6